MPPEKPKRHPVKQAVQLTSKQWAVEMNQRVMGVDPGLAKTGVVVLERKTPASKPVLLMGKVVKTELAPKKERSRLRVTTDDERRYQEIWKGLEDIRLAWQPFSVGVEIYTHNPKGQQGNSQTIKALGVYVGTLFWAHSRNMYGVGFRPGDLKIRFCGNKSASKVDMRKALCKLVTGLGDLLKKLPKGEHEHIGDAAGHAYLALEEVDRTKLLVGL